MGTEKEGRSILFSEHFGNFALRTAHGWNQQHRVLFPGKVPKKRDVAAVWRPSGAAIRGRIGGKSQRRSARADQFDVYIMRIAPDCFISQKATWLPSGEKLGSPSWPGEAVSGVLVSGGSVVFGAGRTNHRMPPLRPMTASRAAAPLQPLRQWEQSSSTGFRAARRHQLQYSSLLVLWPSMYRASTSASRSEYRQHFGNGACGPSPAPC